MPTLCKWALYNNLNFPLILFDVKEIVINPKLCYQVTHSWSYTNDKLDHQSWLTADIDEK